jgi:hypothetical protein
MGRPARHLAPDASFTNLFGMVMYGASAFAKRHAEILDTFYKHTIKYHFIRRIRFVTDQSGRREGIAIDRAWKETSYRVMSLDCLASGGGESPPPYRSQPAILNCSKPHARSQALN